MARAERRAVVAGAAAAVRRLAEALVTTGAADADVGAAGEAVDALAARLEAEPHPGPYSGLLGREPDYTTPVGPLPLSPIIGDCSPVRPDVTLEYRDGRVRGTAVFGKRFIGPPGVAHGGAGALLADQLVALAPHPLGLVCVTRSMTVRYRRPVPLFEPLELEAWGELVGERRVAAWATVSAAGELVLEAEADLVVAAHITGTERPRTPAGG